MARKKRTRTSSLRRQDFQQHPHCDARIFSRARPTMSPHDCAPAHERFEEKIQIKNASYLQPAPSRSTTGGANLERTAPASRSQLPPTKSMGPVDHCKTNPAGAVHYFRSHSLRLRVHPGRWRSSMCSAKFAAKLGTRHCPSLQFWKAFAIPPVKMLGLCRSQLPF